MESVFVIDSENSLKRLSTDYIKFLVRVYKKIVREGLDPENADHAWRGYYYLKGSLVSTAWCEKFVKTVPAIRRVAHLDRFRDSTCKNETWLPGGVLVEGK